MSNQETIKGIREQLKAIKEAISVIEFKLSQLESESQVPVALSEQQPAKRPPGVEERPPPEDETEQPLKHPGHQASLVARVFTRVAGTRWIPEMKLIVVIANRPLGNSLQPGGGSGKSSL